MTETPKTFTLAELPVRAAFMLPDGRPAVAVKPSHFTLCPGLKNEAGVDEQNREWGVTPEQRDALVALVTTPLEEEEDDEPMVAMTAEALSALLWFTARFGQPDYIDPADAEATWTIGEGCEVHGVPPDIFTFEWETFSVVIGDSESDANLLVRGYCQAHGILVGDFVDDDRSRPAPEPEPQSPDAPIVAAVETKH